MKLTLILNSVLWLAKADISPDAKGKTISIKLTPDVAEDKMSPYFERDLDTMFDNQENSVFFDLAELG